MKTETILNLILGLLAVAVAFVSYYFYIRAKIQKAAESAIDDAEKDDKTGEEKLDEATDSVCAIIPAVLKPVIKRDFVKAIVQAAFDRIEAYAKKQVEKKGKRGG